MAATIGREFVLAGNAIFTASNPHGQRYTYRVRRWHPAGDESRVVWFVDWLRGPDNTSDYQYLGVLDLPTCTLKSTPKSGAKSESLLFRVGAWALGCLMGTRQVPPGYAIQHAGRCGRCGRLLTVPESIDRGIGPECAALMGVA